MINKSTLTRIYLPTGGINTSIEQGAFYNAGVSLYDAIGSYLTINDVRTTTLNEEKFIATASQTAFVLTGYTPAAISGTLIPIRVYRNGTRLTWVASAPAAGQFTYSGSTVTTSSSTVSDVIIVEYLK